MHLVLNKEVDERHQRREEGTCKELSVFECGRIAWAQSKAAQGPWQGRYEVRDHENVVPVVIVGRGHVRPSATSQ